MNIEEAKKELLEIKKDNESKAMIINNNSSNMQIRWSNKDLKEMSEISQRCAREIRAIETVLSELEKKDTEIIEAKEANRQLSLELEKKEAIINEMAKTLKGVKSGSKYCNTFKIPSCKKDKSYPCDKCIKEYFTKKVEGK